MSTAQTTPQASSWTAPTVRLEPEASLWAGLLAARKAPDGASTFRSELGLPAQGPVVMSGHQAEIWHPGILTKMIALREFAARTHAAVAWVVVDQDSNEPGLVRYPSRLGGGPGGPGRLISATWNVGRLMGAADIPTASRSPWTDADLDPNWGDRPAATPGVACGLARIRDALRRNAAQPTLAAQLTAATAALAGEGGEAPTMCMASAIARTGAFADIVERMRSDWAVCARAYNDAAAASPGAGLKPLAIDRGELPLWRLGAGQPRRRVYAAQLQEIPIAELAPRALLMTAILREFGCDLFIHGLGGGIYDHATERWMGEWLGWALAPSVVATGTCVLPLRSDPPPSDLEVGRAVWQAHHARHDPGVLGDAWARRRKQDLVAEIADHRRRGEDPAPSFDELHRLLSRVRIENAAGLDALVRRAQELRQGLADAKVAGDRTWAFALYDAEQLVALRDRVRARFTGGGR